ncbi:MAG: sigma-70 family RNA polymerase sigma factor [Lachnospiraceae bacterium]|nr:sigma-70 family RNA polymerase sigma factor [Lachnospiraceae bacterium]
MAYSYVRNEADAMDVVQEASYKAIYNASKLRNPEYVDTWIGRIVINAAMEVLRKSSRFEQEIADEDASYETEFADLDLREALEHLDPKDRSIIELRFFEDLDLNSISNMLGENLSTVKSRLYRALRKLKLDLGDEG